MYRSWLWIPWPSHLFWHSMAYCVTHAVKNVKSHQKSSSMFQSPTWRMDGYPVAIRVVNCYGHQGCSRRSPMGGPSIVQRSPWESNPCHALDTSAQWHSTVHPKWVFQTVPRNATEFFPAFFHARMFVWMLSHHQPRCGAAFWFGIYFGMFVAHRSLNHRGTAVASHAARQKQFSCCQQWRVAIPTHLSAWCERSWMILKESNVRKLTQYHPNTQDPPISTHIHHF